MRRRASSLFEFSFSNQLLPSLEQGTVIVMDNSAPSFDEALYTAFQLW